MRTITSDVELTDVLNNHTYVVVDFWAKWCAPCLRITPVLEALALQYTGIEFVKVDVDDNQDIVTRLGITAMPTFQFYVMGVKVDEFKGADRTRLERAVATLIPDLPVNLEEVEF